jgi:UDP-N-acetyl-D-mannosaminuronate dehydrogenase
MKKRNFPCWEHISKSIIEAMGSGYIGIPFYGLLVECDEDVALDIDAKRVNIINIRDAQKKASGNFFLEN